LDVDIVTDKQGEPFSETKTRIQERLGIADKEFSRFKFNLVTSYIYKQPSAVEEGESRATLIPSGRS